METMNNMSDKRSGYVAIIGRPNVGKSTLMNRIIGQKIAIQSNKPQTTRNKIQTVYTDDRGQLIFLDTPGINKAKNKLGDYMLDVALSSIKDADVILWLVEPSDYIGRGEKYIISELEKLNQPVILAMNKIDTVSKEELIGFVDTYSKAFHFDEIVPVSAAKNDNVDTLVAEIFKYMPYGPMFYDEETLTDQTLKQISAEIIREKALKLLQDEVPHGIAVVIDKYKERTNRNGEPVVDIEATIVCEKDSHKGIIIGRNGEMLKKIGSAARYEIEEMTESKVGLKLWVKVNKEWRNSESKIKNYGYDKSGR